MLDKLNEQYKKINNNKSIFENKNLKWFDPANGMGNFPIIIYLNLMEGLKKEIPDEQKRKKYILESMLYMSEKNKKNCYITRQIFDINNEYKINLYEGDSLTLDIKKEFGINKFDIIIGNPPYNEKLTKAGAKPLYNKFIEYYTDKCNYMSFIVPSRWFAGGKGLDKFREMMLKRNDIVYIKHFDDASKIFGNTVNIEGGV
jgi:type I restriction-modification system DNA methylase subunit